MDFKNTDFAAGLILAGLVLLSPTSVRSQENKRESLRGIKAVAVVVEDLSPRAEQAGLQKTLLKGAVESRLNEKGVQLTTEEENAKTSDAPTIYVQVKTVKHDRNDIEAISITVQLRQRVKLSRDPGVEVPAVTWQSLRLGSVDKKEIPLARHVLISILDTFITDYFAVNPR